MIIESPHAPVEIPKVSIYELLFGSLSTEDAARTALIEGETGREISYGTLKRNVDLFAGALAARGIGVGDTVALMAPNIPEFVVAFHGILRSGATATTVNSMYTAGDVTKQIKASGATLLVTVKALAERAVSGAEDAGFSSEHIIVMDDDGEHPLWRLCSRSGTLRPRSQ